MNEVILHVVMESSWQCQISSDLYYPANFEKEGFTHCCTEDQLQGVLSRYFNGVSEKLLLLHIEVSKIEFPVLFEAGPTGELFPHIYGPIRKAAISKLTTL